MALIYFDFSIFFLAEYVYRYIPVNALIILCVQKTVQWFIIGSITGLIIQKIKK